jgi:hypothetical protein
LLLLLLAAGVLCTRAELVLLAPNGTQIRLPECEKPKAWARRMGIPEPDKFARAFGARVVGAQHAGFTFVEEARPQPRSFAVGLLAAASIASLPVGLQEAYAAGGAREVLVGLLLAIPLAVCMGLTSLLVHSYETSALAPPPHDWVPGTSAFGLIFGLWAVLLFTLSVVWEIKAGAVLMVREPPPAPYATP